MIVRIVNKQIILSIVVSIIVGCSLKNNTIDNNEKIIVKYYKKTLVYNDKWYQYKPKYIYYDEASNDFNISKPFQCSEPGDEVSEVYFKNKDKYKKNIPFKLIEYCYNVFIDDTTNEESYVQYIVSKRRYDNQGRIVSIEYPRYKKNKIFKYTKNTKEIITYYKDSNKTKTAKYIYDDNKKLLELRKYKNGKFNSIYKIDKKDKNKLLEYNSRGELTIEFFFLKE